MEYFGKDHISAVDETKSRKPRKATVERLAKATKLLRDLGLWKEGMGRTA